VRFDQVWFRYGRRGDWTLQAVNASVHPGETVVVQGRNGAGKSTLLQLAVGVLRPVRGRVHDRPSVLGWVPERFPADQPFTAGQYLTRMAALRGLTGHAAARTVGDWVDRLGLGAHRDTRLAELSKGTAQKVGLAQALLVTPGLLVLDEPWEGLDATAREMVPAIVAEVVSAGGAVLVSDHRGEIARLPDATRWVVEKASVRPATTPVRDSGGDDEGEIMVVEIAVRRADAAETAARLRADGHQVLGVRPDGIAGGRR
jgi:ABC-type multidrug transport system ATPase subunit